MVAVVEAVFPIVWLNLIDNVIVPLIESRSNISPTGQEIETSGLWLYTIIFFSLGIVIALSVYAFISFAGRIQEYVMYDIRQDMFNKLQKLSFSFYDKSAVGWLMSRITSDSVKVTELISWGLIEVVWGIGMIVFCLSGNVFI